MTPLWIEKAEFGKIEFSYKLNIIKMRAQIKSPYFLFAFMFLIHFKITYHKLLQQFSIRRLFYS